MQTLTVSSSRSSYLATFTDTLPGKITVGLASTLVVAAAAHIIIPLPFTPVPLSMGPLAVLGVGLALGPVGGFFALLAYLLEGAAGLPVFSPAGIGGFAQLFGATGGYLLSYPLVAAIAGGATRIFHTQFSRFTAALLGCTLATVLLFVCGAGWIMELMHLSLYQAWIVAVAPFLSGEAVKVIVSAGIYSALTRTTRIQ